MSDERFAWSATWGVLIVLVATAGSFAAVEPGSRAWFLWASIACLLLASWHLRGERMTRPLVALGACSAAVIAWGALQCVPLPQPVLRALSPKVAALYAQTVAPGGGASLPSFLAEKAPVLGGRLAEGATVPAGAPDRGGFGVGRTLSISPEDTRQALRSWLAPALLALATALVAGEPLRRAVLLWGIGLWSGLLGGLALLQRFTGVNWFLRGAAPADSDPIGPFINSNHLATYTAVGALVALGLVLAHLGRPGVPLTRADLRRAMVDSGFAFPRILAASAAAVLSIAGLLVSGSRGGWAAFGAGFAVLVIGMKKARWAAAVLLAAIVAGVLVGVVSWVSVGGGTEISPFLSNTKDASAAERLDGWARTLQVAVDHPVSGTGLGTFRWAYASYQRRGEWSIWQQAHNDYLQLLSEGGAVGALVLLAGMFVIGQRIVRPALRGGPGGPRWTTIAVVAAITALAVHAVVEFGLQMPAIAALGAVGVGVLTAAASDGDGDGERG